MKILFENGEKYSAKKKLRKAYCFVLIFPSVNGVLMRFVENDRNQTFSPKLIALISFQM
jgi:hypothetical protein